MKKEHCIGDRFEKNGIVYEVRKSNYCENCALYSESEDGCTDYGNQFETCYGKYRQDKQNVVFVKVSEATLKK